MMFRRSLTSFFSYSFLLLILSACTSTQLKPTSTPITSKEGQWESKAQLTNLTKNESHVVNLDVYAVNGSRLRLEATGPLGIRLASILLVDNQFSAIEYTQQKAYLGSDKNGETVSSVFKIPINPKWFYSLFFDEALPAPAWKCEHDENHIIKSCENTKLQFKVQWLERNQYNKRIIISNPQYSLNILTKDFQPKVQSPERVFKLKIPENYKTIQLSQ